jgi:ACS family sodium-dependent inorganic phosphate cotransporter
MTGRAARASFVVVMCAAAVFISYLDRTNISVASIAMQEQFHWTETTKGLVLSSFFVGYLLLQVVSGALANRFGGRRVLGVAVLFWSLFTLLTPAAAMVSLGMLIAARVALGLGEAAVFPASINMVGRWVAPEKRSSAVTLITSGVSLGTLVALPATSALVKGWGWPMPFYVFGLVGIVWAVVWFVRVGEGTMHDTAPVARGPVPWGTLLRSPAVWAMVMCHFSNNWGLYVLLSWLPSYFKATYGASLASVGWLSALPWLLSFAMSVVSGRVADAMLKRGQSATRVRKFVQVIGTLLPALSLLALTQAPSLTIGLVLMCCATSTAAWGNAGFAANGFDLAPRYADVLWGLSNTVATLPGVFGVYLTGWLVDRTGGYAAPFYATAGVYLLGFAAYMVFGSGRRVVE